MTEYEIAWGETGIELEEAVKKLIELGWRVSGGVSVTSNPESHRLFCQAMVREETQAAIAPDFAVNHEIARELQLDVTGETWEGETRPESPPVTMDMTEALMHAGKVLDARKTLMDAINDSPKEIRDYIHDLEARCDPSGDVRTLHDLKQQQEVLGEHIEFISRDNRDLREVGTKLAEAAMYSVREHDGLHRLSLAAAAWCETLANEGGRGERHSKPEA